MSDAPTLAPDAVPRLLRGVRVKFDPVRQRHVLLAPERVFMLDPIGQAVLGALDGERTFGAIVADLAARYDAPAERIAADAGRFLSGLIARRMVEAA